MPTSIQDLSPEVFMAVLSHIDPVDYLKVKLVSKSFSQWASVVFKRKIMTKAEVIQGQTSLEASLPRSRRLKHLICTHCGLVKSTSSFSDNQAVKTNRTRICISCGISRGRYTRGQMPKVNGVEQIPCWHCRQAVPKYKEWERLLAAGKATLTKILKGSNTGGFLQCYAAGDGRFLAWPHELQVLAFCEQCLELMLRHKQAVLGLRH